MSKPTKESVPIEAPLMRRAVGDLNDNLIEAVGNMRLVKDDTSRAGGWNAAIASLEMLMRESRNIDRQADAILMLIREHKKGFSQK